MFYSKTTVIYKKIFNPSGGELFFGVLSSTGDTRGYFVETTLWFMYVFIKPSTVVVPVKICIIGSGWHGYKIRINRLIFPNSE